MGSAGEVGGPKAGSLDLTTFNHWLCVSRVRATIAVAAIVGVLTMLHVGSVRLGPVAGVCGGLLLVSAIGLRWTWIQYHPRLFFHLQTAADLGATTAGLHFALAGDTALAFRLLYALVIVPPSLISVSSGLAVAAAASLGHLTLLGLEQGFSTSTLTSVEALVPAFSYFLVAQQCFFYAAHLEQKNVTLARLATHLRDSQRRLAAEHRMSGTLVEVARALSSTLEAPELLDRMNHTARERARADWAATFLVDSRHATYRLAAVTDGQLADSALSGVELPLHAWAPVARLVHEPIAVVHGDDAGHLPSLAGGRDLSTVVLAALYNDGALSGFLVVGYRAIGSADLEPVLDLLAGIAEHANIALRNTRLLEEVREASAMKSEFVSAISHELRSPLNVMLGYLEMVLDEACGPLTAAQRDTLSRSQAYSVSLLEMITALLDLNRLEAGRLSIERQVVSVGALLEEIGGQLPDTWRRPEVDVVVVVPADLPAVDTDAGKLKTIVRNLVHNALKFTERGTVTVEAHLVDGDALAISVRDTGRGIPPDALGYIFDMFRQVPGAGGGGVGVGLHLVQRLAVMLGGSVRVESALGRGTVFTVTLPRATVATGVRAA